MENIHIAIADDHAMVRAGLSGLIDSFEGFTVNIQADNGKDLIDRLERAKELPEICIVDISMPVMNGYETVSEIKKKWPDIKVLALTMLDNEYCVIKMIANGASGYILKGDNSNKLEKALRTIHQNGAYHTDLISNQLFHALMTKSQNSPKLNEKEIQLLKYVCSDMTYVEIAEQMKTSARSVEGYRDSLFQKFNVNSRISLALLAIRLGIVPFH